MATGRGGWGRWRRDGLEDLAVGQRENLTPGVADLLVGNVAEPCSEGCGRPERNALARRATSIRRGDLAHRCVDQLKIELPDARTGGRRGTVGDARILYGVRRVVD